MFVLVPPESRKPNFFSEYWAVANIFELTPPR